MLKPTINEKGGSLKNVCNYSSIPDTREHINKVAVYLTSTKNEISIRAINHDASKMQSPELETFDRVTPKLKDLTYGSPEYIEQLAEMSIVLEHHYKENRHHPEHFKNGITDMNLIDILEMFCDWLAATKRHTDGNIFKSIEINAKRFGYDEVLKEIFKNTAVFFEEKKI